MSEETQFTLMLMAPVLILLVMAIAGYLLQRGRAKTLALELLNLSSTEREASQALAIAEHEAVLLRRRQQELLDEQQILQRKMDRLGALRNDSEQRTAALDVQLAERAKHEASLLKQFHMQKQLLTAEFENLANKIFDDKGKHFTAASSGAMNQLLQPFREQIEGFQNRVNDVHNDSLEGRVKLEQQIKSVLELGLKMSDEASNLTSALKSDKKLQGSWGEIQAELLLESSGLKEGREYFREMSLKSDDGRDFRPDFVIKLPSNKHMVVDSKMSLNAYVNACSANTDEERESYLREHVNAIRKHIKSLSEKCYEKLKGLNTPDYVFMFIGNEAAYLAAVEAEPKLFHEAYRKGVAVVTAGTLLSSLRIAAHLWSIDRQNSNTHLLAEQASKVYEKLRVFISKMDKLGVQLNTLQSSYDDSVRTLTSGKGSLQRQVNLFVDMGVSVKEEMPQLDTDIE